MTQRRFQEQFERMDRFMMKVVFATGRPADYEDDLWAFFQNAWHLKDWIKNDPATGVESRIEEAVARHEPLMICADLCNRSKHLKLVRKRLDADVQGRLPRIVEINRWDLKEKPPKAEVAQEAGWEYIVVLEDGREMSASYVALAAYDAWSTVLQEFGLSH
jgi:hypothetical protein